MELCFKSDFKAREYQINIANTAISKNTLVVLPTGTGKTIIGMIVAINRLRKFPDSKVLILAPTRPLANQHKQQFLKFTNINPFDIEVVTGKISPTERKTIYKRCKVICATPQTIKNDIESGILDLENVSLIVFDECHRAVKDYPYTFIAREYIKKAKNPLILGLTASPGSEEERIEEIKRNLCVKAVEIRTEKDKDLQPYVKKIRKIYVYVDLPEELKKAKGLIEIVRKELIDWLYERGVINEKNIKKKELLELQKKLIEEAVSKGKVDCVKQAIIQKVLILVKIEHLLELLETQSAIHFLNYLEKLEKSRKRHEKIMVNDPRIREAREIVKGFVEKDMPHPKIEKLIDLLSFLIEKNPNVKIIVFANYRSTVEYINKKLRENGIKSKILIGQAKKEGKGMSQKEQIRTINEFSLGLFNVLICSSIGEEGLDIPKTDYAIFYEPVPSEIRLIQRRGRVGRSRSGTVIFLITKGTRDEAYYWASFHKERKMKRLIIKTKKELEDMKSKILYWLKK